MKDIEDLAKPEERFKKLKAIAEQKRKELAKAQALLLEEARKIGKPLDTITRQEKIEIEKLTDSKKLYVEEKPYKIKKSEKEIEKDVQTPEGLLEETINDGPIPEINLAQGPYQANQQQNIGGNVDELYTQVQGLLQDFYSGVNQGLQAGVIPLTENIAYQVTSLESEFAKSAPSQAVAERLSTVKAMLKYIR